jgi:undecaprenyl-diphosphatase
MTAVDLALMAWLRAVHAPWLDLVMSIVTISGIMAGIWQLIAVLSLIPARTRAAAFRALLTLWLALFVVDVVLKPAVGRSRPAHGADESIRLALATDAEERSLAPASRTSSFPSGHATSATAGAIAIGRVWPQGRVVWWTVAALIAYSRIYLGHHYPTDVIGGVVVGTLIAWWVLGGRRPGTHRAPLPNG